MVRKKPIIFMSNIKMMRVYITETERERVKGRTWWKDKSLEKVKR